MRKYLTISFFVFLLVSCHSGPRYGKDVVNLDNFDFGLDLNTFFEDESYFRSKSDNYKLNSTEESLSDTTYTFYQYSTFSYSQKEPLAKFEGIKFEQLGLLSDSTDRHVLLIAGSTSYATAAQVKEVIDDLLKIDSKPKIYNAFMSGTSLVFQAPDRVISVYLNFSVEKENDKDDRYYDYDESERQEYLKNKYVMKDSEYKSIIEQLDIMKEDINVTLFVSELSFDKIYNKYKSGSSGFMTRYVTHYDY